ncbi:hypothetical protein FHT32_000041 [Variovorax sp. SG517]|uniref:hypothetical protein n=1 Tax=Variovorax sp. SG517 TaxID=2587117 RepID=UPI00159D3D0D|nr:hypothetical protein [Variovorax sp. SG517]NVM86418.1 hypothetical protein [Variovorax sp. SG517]
MSQDIAFAIHRMQRGLVTDTVVLHGIRRLPEDRLAGLFGFDPGQRRQGRHHLFERRG